MVTPTIGDGDSIELHRSVDSLVVGSSNKEFGVVVVGRGWVKA